MSQNYVILTGPKFQSPLVIVYDQPLDKECFNSDPCNTIVSAGSVSFVTNKFGRIDIDVTHGSKVLGIAPDLNQLSLDQKILARILLDK